MPSVTCLTKTLHIRRPALTPPKLTGSPVAANVLIVRPLLLARRAEDQPMPPRHRSRHGVRAHPRARLVSRRVCLVGLPHNAERPGRRGRAPTVCRQGAGFRLHHGHARGHGARGGDSRRRGRRCQRGGGGDHRERARHGEGGRRREGGSDRGRLPQRTRGNGGGERLRDGASRRQKVEGAVGRRATRRPGVVAGPPLGHQQISRQVDAGFRAARGQERTRKGTGSYRRSCHS